STFTVKLQDASQSVNQSLSITVNAPPLVVGTSSLPTGTTNAVYPSQTLTATGGTPGYTWSLASGSGPLPAGLTLAANGTISGTPTANGTANFTVQVQDSALRTATQALSITISAAASASVVGYWSFDDGSATDNSGNGNNGTLVNGPTMVAGKSGQALNFNGSNQYVNVGNVLNPGSGDFSIFAWVKTTQAGSFNMIISKRDASLVTNSGYQLFQNSSNAPSFAFGDGSSSGRVRIDATAPRINDGVW